MVFAHKLNTAALAGWLLIIAVALLPFGLGGNRPLPLGLFQLAVAGSMLFTLLSPELLKQTRWPRAAYMAMLGLLIVLCWAIVQATPIVPAPWAHPLWQEAAQVLQAPTAASIAIDKAAAWQAMLRYFTYVAVGALAFIHGHSTAFLQRLLSTLLISAGAQMLYAFGAFYSGNTHVLWFLKTTHTEDMTGTFVNRNHFGVYCGLMLIISCGWLWQNLREHHGKSLQQFKSLKALTVSVLIALLVIALFKSHGRAALLCSAAGLLLFTCAFLIYLRRRVLAFAMPITLAVLLGFAFAAYAEQIGRFATLFSDYSSTDRWQVYQTTWDAILTNPWLGYGIGNFESIFRFFRTESIGSYFNHAHSDWLESIFDLGIPAALVLWGSLITLLLLCVSGIFVRKQNGLYPALALGCSGLLLSHAAVEFSLQMPALVCLWATLLGAGVAQSRPSQPKA